MKQMKTIIKEQEREYEAKDRLEDLHLTIFNHNGTTTESDVRIHFDGNTILLDSINAGEHIGYIKINKKGEQKLLDWINEDGRLKKIETKREVRI